MFKHDWSSANYGIAYKDISFPEYSNVQCTEAFDNSKWQLASTLTAKYQIQPNNGDLLCFFTSDDAETVSGALAIVDSDGKVYDQIDAYVDGAILIRQFTVNSVNSCSVYTFVPDSKESIDIISLWTHKDMKIPGKIRRDDYVIENMKFDLKETSYTGKITMSCAIHIREQKPLWEY